MDHSKKPKTPKVILYIAVSLDGFIAEYPFSWIRGSGCFRI